jgi:PAS domain S-box-containing protein
LRTLPVLRPLIRRGETQPPRKAAAQSDLDHPFRDAALRAAGVGAFRWDPGDGRLELDACGRAMFGLSPTGPLCAADLLGRIAAGGRERLAAALAGASTDEPLCLGVRVQWPDAGERTVLCLGRATHGALIDVTGQTAREPPEVEPSIGRPDVEHELRQSAADLEQQVAARTAERDRLWRFSRDIMLVMDIDGIALAANPAMTRILGWSAEELTGRNVLDLIHPDDHDVVMAAIGRVLDQDPTQPSMPSPESDVFEIRCQHQSGHYDWISWVAGFEKEEGRTIYATGRLISGEKAAAAELHLAQEALRQSQKLEAMGQLTGGVAHDFNNLLTPIIAGLDMLQRRQVGGDRERRLIDAALQSAERARVLVQRLLAFARRQPLQPTAIDVAELFLGMKELICSTAGPRIRVDFKLDSQLPAARADANQLEMALLNLAVNARDAMTDGGVLTISASAHEVVGANRHQLAPGEYVAIGVADTGTGMDAETLRRCIEPFYSTKGVGRGTGLGLSMVHGLASQLGGMLEIESAPGDGARIRLWLPVSETAAPGPARRTWTPLARSARGRALVVDDEELVRASTAEMLAELGYDVVEAVDADDALRLLDGAGQIDVLVTDHMMPGMTGVDLARTVRASHPRIRVLIVSGYAEMEGLAPDLPRLTKPFRQTDLAAVLFRLDAEALLPEGNDF